MNNNLKTTVDQWRELLYEYEKPKYPNGKTLAELTRELDIPRATVRDKLKKAIKLGKCKAYNDIRNNRMTTVYILQGEDNYV